MQRVSLSPLRRKTICRWLLHSGFKTTIIMLCRRCRCWHAWLYQKADWRSDLYSDRAGETDGYSLFDSPNMKAKLIHCHPSDDEIENTPPPAIAASPNSAQRWPISLPLISRTARWAAKNAFDASFTINPQPGNGYDGRAHLSAIA